MVVNDYQPYVEDYNSELSEAIPIVPARRRATKGPSGLNQSSTVEEVPEPSYEGVSDSGYSSHSVASTPITETPPPPKAPTPAPVRTHQPSRSSSGPIPFNRPPSKSFSRTASPAAPRNIPNVNSGSYGYSGNYGVGSESSQGGGSSDCDCPDCGKTPSKSSPTISSSSSATSGAWPIHHHSPSYGQPPSYSGYQYPSRYDGYSTPTDSAISDSSAGAGGSRKNRSSMPPPPRPQSTFAGSTTTTSTHSSGSIPWSHAGSYSSAGYFDTHPSTSSIPPAPSTTCPPGYGSSMYAPPPLNTSIAPPPPQSSSYSGSPYAPPSVPDYGYPPATDYTAPDYYGQSMASSTPSSSLPPSDYRGGYRSSEYSAMPPPPAVNRRSSMRAQTSASASLESSPDYTHSVPHRPQRRMSSRAHGGERPPSWYGQSQLQYHEVPERSYSVPPTNAGAPAESSRRKGATPQPMRRRESNNSQGTSGSHSARLGPSALSRSMEACAIDDHTPRSSHHRHSSSGNYYDSHHAVARREPGTMMQSSHSNRSSDSGNSSGHDGREELVQLTVPDSDEPFTMRYPAGVPVKLQLNGGTFQRILSFGRKSKNVNIEKPIAYRYVQQRQQQVHAQLQYGAGQLDHSDRRTSAEYHHRSNGYARREMAGV